MRLPGRFRRGNATIEFLILFPIFLGALFLAMAFALAALARAEVSVAARAGARVAAIECGQGHPSWAADAQAAAVDDLREGGLTLASEVRNPTQADDWYVGSSCSSFGQAGGVAAVQVQYAVRDLFPGFGALLGGTAETGAWSLNEVASFPTE